MYTFPVSLESHMSQWFQEGKRQFIGCLCVTQPEAYLEPCQTSKVELFKKIIIG